MTRLKLMTIAESAVVDARTNSVSLFNILEQINAASFPAVIPKVVLFALFERDVDDGLDDGKYLLRVKLDDEILLEGPFMARFQGKSKGVRGFGEFQSMVLPKPGRLDFVLIKEDVELGRWTIWVESLTRGVLKQPVIVDEILHEVRPAGDAPTPTSAEKA